MPFFPVCEVFLLQRNSCFFSLSPIGGEEKNLKTRLVWRAGILKITSALSDLAFVEVHLTLSCFYLLPSTVPALSSGMTGFTTV